MELLGLNGLLMVKLISINLCRKFTEIFPEKIAYNFISEDGH